MPTSSEREAAKGQVDYETATHCPKCGMPGEVASRVPAPNARRRGTQVHYVYCRNEVCSWFNTNWIVQVNEDGSIPLRADQGEKVYPGLPGGLSAADEERRAVESLARQLQAETQAGGAEIRNPRSR